MKNSLNAQELSEEYFTWYKENTEYKNIESNIIQIDLPFMDNFSDEISIYAIGLNDGRIKLTDDGWTINNLEDMGVNIKRSKTRRKIFSHQIKAYGVSDIDDELYIIVSATRFAEAKHRLLQAILFINDMFMLASKNTNTLFFEDIALFFEANKIRAVKNVSYLGKSGLSHKFEFSIPGFKEIPTRLIKTMSYANNPMFAKSILTDVEQTKPLLNDPSVFYVFLNDTDDNHKINPDIITLFNQNDVKTVLYSERNTVINELAK
uniref:Lj965 prophage protein n=1 Tax=Loigolactobacillus rennini TaxID=238013 RepID=A0A1K2I9G7_9LACO|nr:Lj965 prophage protein [Loigolactobacillus rennini]